MSAPGYRVTVTTSYIYIYDRLGSLRRLPGLHLAAFWSPFAAFWWPGNPPRRSSRQITEIETDLVALNLLPRSTQDVRQYFAQKCISGGLELGPDLGPAPAAQLHPSLQTLSLFVILRQCLELLLVDVILNCCLLLCLLFLPRLRLLAVPTLP